MGIGNGDEAIVLIRPLCRVAFRSDVDFDSKLDASRGYLWSRSIDGFQSVDCDCVTDDVELLSCELKEESKDVQECNFLDSSVGGICPYTISTSQFKVEEESADGFSRTFRGLSPYEARMLTSLAEPRYLKRAVQRQFGLGAKEHLSYAVVKPHQSLRISQRWIHCGSYLTSTSEMKFEYEIAEPRTWVLNPATGRLYYFSRESERETRENAASKCKDLGGRLATLDRPEEADFAARIVAKNFNNGTTSWWTAATTGEHDEKCWLRWERGGLGNNLHLGPCREDAPCILMKLFWPSDPVASFFLTECENQLPFVCEKLPEL